MAEGTPGSHKGMPVMLSAGRVGRPHGLDGSFHVTRPRPRLLDIGIEVTVGGRAMAVVRLDGTEARPIVRLAGIDDRAAVQELRGEDLAVPIGDAPRLQENEWWAHELEGCEVFDGERRLGRVSRLLELPSCEALEVVPADSGATLLVPLVKDAIRSVDPTAARIEVDMGFLGLAEEASPAAGEGKRGGPS